MSLGLTVVATLQDSLKGKDSKSVGNVVSTARKLIQEVTEKWITLGRWQMRWKAQH